MKVGFPGGAGVKNSPADECRRHKSRRRFDLWVGKMPWKRKWQPTPVSLPGECHGQGNLAGTVQRAAQSDMTGVTEQACNRKHGWVYSSFLPCSPPIMSLGNLAITLHLEHVSVQTSPSSDARVARGSPLGWHRSQSGLNTSGDRALTPSWMFTPSPQALSWELSPGQPGRTQHPSLHPEAGWYPLQGINSPANMRRSPPPAPLCGRAPRCPTPSCGLCGCSFSLNQAWGF